MQAGYRIIGGLLLGACVAGWISLRGSVPPEASWQVPQNLRETAAEAARSSAFISASAIQHRVRADPEVPAGRAVDVEARLRNAARAGDGEASFSIYRKLSRCTDPLLNNDRQQLLAAYRLAGVSTESIERVTATLQAECADAEHLLPQRGEWLERAAAQGIAEAQRMYAADPAAILGTDRFDDIDPADATLYAEQSEAYLQNLAQHGDVDAMFSLSALYEGSPFRPRDDIRAAAYRWVAERVAPWPIPPQPSDVTMAGLGVVEQQHALKLARDIYARCCSR